MWSKDIGYEMEKSIVIVLKAQRAGVRLVRRRPMFMSMHRQ
jgi:hypothetical protein